MWAFCFCDAILDSNVQISHCGYPVADFSVE